MTVNGSHTTNQMVMTRGQLNDVEPVEPKLWPKLHLYYSSVSWEEWRSWATSFDLDVDFC